MEAQGSEAGEARLELAAQVSFGGFRLEVDEALRLRGITALFGPSGGGKSTLLRIIAGLARPRDGRVALVTPTERLVWQDRERFTPPHRRPIGFMFQDARLFPHLCVAQNLAFAERRSRSRAGDSSITTEAVAAALDLDRLMGRRPGSLSGGERQRVALGRTLLTRPRLLLLDEPLSALDLGRKAEILPYLQAAPRRFGVPALYVSHAVEEIAQIADWVAALSDGRVRAQGPTAQVLERLDLAPLTGRFEAGAVIEAEVAAQDAAMRLTRLSFEGQPLSMPMAAGLSVGARVRLRVRARDVALALGGAEALRGRISVRNIVEGRVSEISVEPNTAFAELRLAVGAQTLRARITREALEELGLRVGAPAAALIKSVSFDRRGLAGGG